MSIPFVHCCIVLDWGLRCSSFIHSKQDSIIRERRKNLSTEKKLQFEFKFRIRLSKSSKILGRCKQTYEIVEILFGDCRVHYVNGAANVTSFFFFFFFCHLTCSTSFYPYITYIYDVGCSQIISLKNF